MTTSIKRKIPIEQYYLDPILNPILFPMGKVYKEINDKSPTGKDESPESPFPCTEKEIRDEPLRKQVDEFLAIDRLSKAKDLIGKAANFIGMGSVFGLMAKFGPKPEPCRMADRIQLDTRRNDIVIAHTWEPKDLEKLGEALYRIAMDPKRKTQLRHDAICALRLLSSDLAKDLAREKDPAKKEDLLKRVEPFRTFLKDIAIHAKAENTWATEALRFWAETSLIFSEKDRQELHTERLKIKRLNTENKDFEERLLRLRQ